MTFHVTIEYDRREPGTDVVPGLEPLYEDPEIEISYLADDRGPELEPVDLQGADAYVSYSYDLTAASLEGVDSLKLATRAGAGYENFDLAAMTEHGVVATHAPQGPTASAAQATAGMIIACAHNFPRMEWNLRERGWEGRVPSEYGFELGSATLGFVGMGLIGGKVLSNLAPFRADGLEAQVYDPYMSEERAAELGVERVDLDTLLETSDIVTIHVPLTEETHHMLGTEDFERMQDSAYLVNTSRGGIYPDGELAEALETGELRGAAIDVFEGEPDVEGNPLLDIEDVLLLPHVAGLTDDSVRRIHELMCESIVNLKNGEPPINVLNPAAYEAITGETLPEDCYSPSFQG
jgi:D-3-phosphoglycerate dehydrogenase